MFFVQINSNTLLLYGKKKNLRKKLLVIFNLEKYLLYVSIFAKSQNQMQIIYITNNKFRFLLPSLYTFSPESKNLHSVWPTRLIVLKEHITTHPFIKVLNYLLLFISLLDSQFNVLFNSIYNVISFLERSIKKIASEQHDFRQPPLILLKAYGIR